MSCVGLVRADGSLDVVHLVGIPVDDARGDGVISPMPRTNPTMLLDTSHATASAVRLLQEAVRPRQELSSRTRWNSRWSCQRPAIER